MKKAKSLPAVSAWWEGVKRNIRRNPKAFFVGIAILLVGLLFMSRELKKTTTYEELRVSKVYITTLHSPQGGLLASHSFQIETAAGHTYSISGDFDAGELRQAIESAPRERVDLPEGGWLMAVPALIRYDGSTVRELTIDGTRYVTYEPDASPVVGVLFVLVFFGGPASLFLAPYFKVEPRDKR